MLRMLQMAAGVALPSDKKDPRNFWLGAVGIRSDGVIVSSRNGAATLDCTNSDQLMPNSHAEGRCLRKLGKHGIIYVARVSRQDQTLKMARPCAMCATRIKSAQVEKVYYTIDENSYGLWLPKTDEWRTFQD